MARFLLDSHVFLWAKEDPGQIDEKALETIRAPENRLFVSLAGLWELAIKAANGKLPHYSLIIAKGADALSKSLQDSNIELMAIEMSHALAAAALPQHHKDPFDRLMIAQALEEDMILATRDAVFARYVGLNLLRV
jgi:PIN domain nuclease of toxin-antitoxin system